MFLVASKSHIYNVQEYKFHDPFFLPPSNWRKRTIAIVKDLEKYETLEKSFSSAINEINTVFETGFIEVDGKEIQIEMFLGGDYKFLFMVMGLDGARSTHWCLTHKLDRWDTSKPIEHYQSIEMKRILAHIKSMLTRKKFSVIHQSLLILNLIMSFWINCT